MRSLSQLKFFDQPVTAESAFFVLVAIWGLTFALSKSALTAIGPFAYNTLRIGLGALTLTILTGRGWRQINRQYIVPVFVSGLILFAAYALQAYGQQFTTASKAGFLTGTSVVYIPLFSAVLLRRQPTKTALLGIALAIGGLYLMSGVGVLRLAPGDTWVALGGIGWALYIIALTRYSPRVNLLSFSALHVALAAALNSVLWLLMEPPTLPRAPIVWLAIGITGLTIIGVGTSIQTWVTRLVSPTRVALITTLEPVFAAIAGMVVGEALSPRTGAGAGLILMGMLIAELAPQWQWNLGHSILEKR